MVHACLKCVYHVTEAVVGTIMVVGVLTCCTLFHCVCDLKVAQINVQCCLIWEFMLSDFQLGYNAMEAMKIFVVWLGDSADNHKRVIRWLKKFCLGYKNLDDQARLGRSKTMDSEAVLTNSTQSVLGKLSITGRLDL